MTRRERMERRLERRLEWAEKRAAKADDLLRQNEPYRGDVAFNTQPGHIPERARAIARSYRAAEHDLMAGHHLQKADGIQAQLERSIFSDDPDAPERLRERIAELEAKRDRIKAYNAAARRSAKNPSALQAAARALTEEERADLVITARVAAYSLGPGGGFPGYVLSNLGGNIRRLRERLAAIERDRASDHDPFPEASRAARFD